jgi:arylsulfatase A-like enzyme
MKAFLPMVLALVVCFVNAAATQNPGADLPNFIILFTDDQGYGDLGAYGHPTLNTPNLDRMAAEGQQWMQFYVADPVCTPSRAALLTGRYPIRNGMTSSKRGVLFPDSSGGLPQSEITIAEILKQKGYATAAIGKWHLGHLPPFLPMAQGFDSYYGIPYSNDMNNNGASNIYLQNADNPQYEAKSSHFDVPLMENENIVERPANQHTITRRYTEKAISFIEEHQSRPFFLYLAHSLPHIPLFTHPDFRYRSTAGHYGDVIEEIDWSVGRILQKLADLGLREKTVVLFTSDNGPWLAFKTHGGSAGPLRAGKGTTFEGGQRVPAIFWGPGIVKPGPVHELGSTLDILPTLAAMSGTHIPTDRKLDGYDLSPLLKGLSSESPRKSFFYWTQGTLFAVRYENWKLHIRQTEPINYWREIIELEKAELYDLGSDFAEKYDRASEKPGLVRDLNKMLEAHQANITNPLPDNLAGTIETRD